MDNEIWVMDSEFCDVCDALLDYFGCCPNGCEFDGQDDDDFVYPGKEDDPDEQPTIGTPEEAHTSALSLVDEEINEGE